MALIYTIIGFVILYSLALWAWYFRWDRKLGKLIGIEIRRPAPDRYLILKNLGIKTIVDVGANEGQFVRKVRNYLPEAWIECFEPIPNIIKDEYRVRVWNFALGDKPEEKEFNIAPYSQSSSFLTEGKKIKVKVHRLDDLLLYPELVKIDVEGYEDKVLLGGVETISKAKAVIIETHFKEIYPTQKLFPWIYNYLINLGFKYQGSLSQKVIEGEIVLEDSLFTK